MTSSLIAKQHNLEYLSDDYEATKISDDDDTQVDELLDHAMSHISVPPFNALSETVATSTTQTQILVLDDLPDDISKEREKIYEEERLAHYRKASLRFRKLPTFTTLGDSSITTKRNNRKRSNFQPVLSKNSKSPSFTVKQLTKDKNILVNKKIRRNFGKPHGSAEGLVKRYDFASDSYEVYYPVDGWKEYLSFHDILRLLPKSWLRKEVEANFASICAHVAKAASEANDRVSQPNAHTLYTEPKTPKAALNAPDAALWKLAMDKEIHLLQDVMGCWEVMNISDLPSNANLIGCKWVYKVKFRENVYDKHRARIVALGYQQRQGVDYF